MTLYRRPLRAGLLCMALVLAVTLGGCGQKGDLYLPHDKPKGMFRP